MNIVIMYLWFCLACGTVMLSYFVFEDIRTLIHNKKNPHNKLKYYLVDNKWQVFIFTIAVTIPVVQILSILILLGMFFEPFSFILKYFMTK